jgi:molybdate transport system substrate-binding protein
MRTLSAPLRLCFAWLTLALGSASAVPETPTAITVFAAASLSDVVTELVARYEHDSRRAVRASFASSSTLARQIENGAAADLFLSADEEWMAYLDERRLLVVGTWIRPISNRLVMIAPADRARPVELKAGFDLPALLGSGRLATGDPAHVPAGRYAQQALDHFGVWDVAVPRLAPAESVRAALALVERGEAPLGIVYATDARASEAVQVVAVFPAESHAPIRYSFAILAGHDRPDVRGLLAFLTSPAGLAIFRAHGFETP